MDDDPKAMLKAYLQSSRESLLWKLDGLGERELRSPQTGTGTNLLGLVKHVASMEFGYFGDSFGRPGPDLPWMTEAAEDNADMYATADESTKWVVDLYRRGWAHADTTIDELPLDAVGRVPWWQPGKDEVSLHRILVHMIAETARHAGHADIVRESIDGAIGYRDGNTNLPAADREWWDNYRATLRRIAEESGGGH
ncbi:MAG: DinB family protein [Propionibacteriaceae bacterium]